jgi:DNA-directed RNA polymerase specialized sigma24 family protein
MTFDEIYNRQYKHVRYFCLSRVRHHHDAEDIAQSVFAEFYKHWDKYRHDQTNDCMGLLMQMAKWLIVAHWRKQKITKTFDEVAPIPVKHKFPDCSQRLLDKVWELPR